jgi:ABC-type sugar transport system ATPase subunit
MVDLVEPVGHEVYLHLEVGGGGRLISRVEPGNPAQVNQHIEVSINMEKVHLFAGGAQQRITEP